MAQIFSPGAGRESFDGVARFQQDVSAAGAGPSGDIYAFADERVTYVTDDNPAFPELVDSTGIRQNLVYGRASGIVQVDGVVMPDRALPALIQYAWGVRTGAMLDPFVMNLIDFSGDTAIKASGLWWSRLRLTGEYADDGEQAMVRFQMIGLVADPKDYYEAPTLGAGVGEGTTGTGISSFDSTSFTNGAAESTVTYDSIRAFSIMLDNKLKPKPAMMNPAQRIGNGYAPGILDGGMSLTQLKGAATAVPMTGYQLPITALIPTGDDSGLWTFDMSLAYRNAQTVLSPDGFAAWQVAYNIFSTNTTNGATSWPYNSAYATV